MPMSIVLPTLMLIILFTRNFCTSVLSVLFPVIMDALHATKIELHQSIAFLVSGIFIAQIFTVYQVNTASSRNLFMLFFLNLCLGSIIGLHATSIYELYLGEFMQGLGIGAAYPLIQGVIHFYLKNKLGILLSTIGSIPITMFFFAPLIGGEFYGSWHDVFYIVLVLALIMLFLSYFIPKTSLQPKRRSSLYQTLKNLYQKKEYLLCILVYAISNVGFFIFIAWSPFLLINGLHLTYQQYSQGMIFPVSALIIGRLANHFLENHRVMASYLASSLHLFAGLLLIGLFILKIFNVWAIYLAGSLFYMGCGIIAIQTSLLIVSIVEENLSSAAMATCYFTANLITAIIIFFIANITLNDGLILGLVFTTCGLGTLFLFPKKISV
ncbi:MAG: MFS transporter [Legionellales bacterium]|nr:MFS transporter [Legionellales bacterium]